MGILVPARGPSILKTIAHNRSLRHIRELEDRIAGQELGSIRTLRQQARELKRAAERAYARADARLSAPLLGGNLIEAPVQSDWVHRPELWTTPVFPSGLAAPSSRSRFGHEAEIFHDCRQPEMTFRQTLNKDDEDTAPYGVTLDVLGFSGTFLSLAVDLPPDALNGLGERHIIRMTARLTLELPIEMFARLNIRHGPNTEQQVRNIPAGETQPLAEWDLSHMHLNTRRIEQVWIDLIFGTPAYNRIEIRDMTLSRRPRADM